MDASAGSDMDASRMSAPGEADGASAASDSGPSGDGGSKIPKTYAELCPGATPGVGTPVPVAPGAQPVRLDPLTEYLDSPIADPADFGLSTTDAPKVLELIENQPDPVVDITYANTDSYAPDTTQPWPAWVSFRFDNVAQTNQVSFSPSGLHRGTYHVSVPLLHQSGPVPDNVRYEYVLHVRGLGFTSDRLPVPHYVGDSDARALTITLAGGDMAWRITDLPSWLRVSQTEGTSLDHVDLQFFREPALDALGPGHYEGRLCVENARGDAESIPVYGLVESPRLWPLHTQRELYSFASTEQLSSYTYVFTVLGEQVAWEGTSDQPWLILARDHGMTNERIDFKVDPTGLSEGRYHGALTFTDPSGKNASTHVEVYYLKENRLATWTLKLSTLNPASPFSPHVIDIESPNAIGSIDIFTNEKVSASLGAETLSSAVVSEYSQRLYAITWNDQARTNTLRSYRWPDLSELGSVETQVSPRVIPGEVTSVLGQEYWRLDNAIVSLADGRSGSVLPAVSNNRERLRVYDDGTTLFGFFEDLGEPPAGGFVHWAHSPTALCNYRGVNNRTVFECTDQGTTYLSLDYPQPPPQFPFGTPLFTHQGGVYFYNDVSSDSAFAANGQQITLYPRVPNLQFGRQWGDTLLIGETAGEAFNYVFEPGPAAVELPALPPNTATCPAPAGQVIAVENNVVAASLLADPVRDRLYAVVRGGQYADELVTFNGSTGALLSHVALGGAGVADLAFDGSVLWVVLGGSAQLARVDLSGDVPVPSVAASIPADWGPGTQLGARDIAVGTGTTDTVAIALIDNNGVGQRVALYIGGVLRDVIQFGEAQIAPGPFGYFFGTGNSQTGTGLFRVDDRHIDPIAQVLNESPFELLYTQERLIAQTSSGTELIDVHDPKNPMTLKTLASATALLPDLAQHRIWGLNPGQNGHAFELIKQDIDTQASTTSYLDGLNAGGPQSLVRTASGCFAFIANNGDHTNVVLFAPPN